jgi:CBS domain-containing membrane protein
VGASAVLLFAVPASPLAQPWPIIGGNVISAFVGFLIAQLIPDPTVAAGAAVAVAIAVMSFARCLHPPGGAVALAVVLGGPAVAKWGVLFPLVPVGLNSCILVALGLLFHRLTRKAYPHVAAPSAANAHGTADLPPRMRSGFSREDIDAALKKLDETFDIDRGDLEHILREIELQTIIRSHAELRCADIMSRDVICIRATATKREASALLQRHGVRLLPVTGDDGRLLGTVGLRELLSPAARIADVLSPARITSPSARAAELLPTLTDGKTHAVIVTDGERRVLGLISQTDLLSAVGRLSFSKRDDALAPSRVGPVHSLAA